MSFARPLQLLDDLINCLFFQEALQEHRCVTGAGIFKLVSQRMRSHTYRRLLAISKQMMPR